MASGDCRGTASANVLLSGKTCSVSTRAYSSPNSAAGEGDAGGASRATLAPTKAMTAHKPHKTVRRCRCRFGVGMQRACGVERPGGKCARCRFGLGPFVIDTRHDAIGDE